MARLYEQQQQQHLLHDPSSLLLVEEQQQQQLTQQLQHSSRWSSMLCTSLGLDMELESPFPPRSQSQQPRTRECRTLVEVRLTASFPHLFLTIYVYYFFFL